MSRSNFEIVKSFFKDRISAWYISKTKFKGIPYKFCALTSYGYYTGYYLNGKRDGEWTYIKLDVDNSGTGIIVGETKIKEECYHKGNLSFTWYK